MKKILVILALMIMATLLASCNGNKEGSESEERGENAQVEATEKTTSKVEAPVTTPIEQNNKSITPKTISWSKTEDQVVKDFENELDWLFKLLESTPNAKK